MFVARFCSNGIVPKNSVNLFQEECLMMVIHVMVTAAGLVCGSCSYESRGRECLRSSPVSSTRTLQGARKRGSGPDVCLLSHRMHSLCQSDLWDLLLGLVRHFCVLSVVIFL